MTKSNYPPHLADPIRLEAINSVVKKELRKLLPSVSDWKKIDKDIDNWNKRLIPRDCWNGVHGIVMGFRLMHHFLHVITAENIKWEKKEVYLDQNLVTGVSIGSIISGLPDSRADAKTINALLEQNKTRFDKWYRGLVKTHNNSKKEFPIVAVQEKFNNANVYSIHDGNNRFVKAIYEGKTKITAFLGTYTTEEFVPKNFWLPTSFLMDLVYNAKLANDPDNLTALLKNLVKLSESGEYELKERVLIGKSEFRNKIKRTMAKK